MKTREDGLVIARELMLRTTTAQLAERFGDHFTEDTVGRFVEEVFDELDQRFTIKTHLPTFAMRFARDRLHALATHSGHIVDHTPSVLFVCRRNDGLSQMAAAMFKAAAPGPVTVHSAGARPAEELLDEAVHVLAEVGISMVEEFPKPLTAEIERAADVIVTLDDHDTIVLLDDDTTQYYAWHTTELHGTDHNAYRRLRDELAPMVEGLVADVVGAAVA